MKYKFNKSIFNNIKNNSKLTKLISLFLILFFFILIFLISLFNDGFVFINITNDYFAETSLRTLVGFASGFGLAIVGSNMQAITRNDLSGPTTLGFLPAATLGILIYKIIGFSSIPLMIFFSFLFALIVLIINFISIKISKNDIKGYKIVLIGIIVGSLISSISIILNTTIPILNENIVPWIGIITLNYNWEKATYALPIILIGSLIILSISNKLNIIEKDPYLAKSLGINIDFIYWFSGLASLLITISSVILIGSLTMIGIIIPHLVRMIFKSKDYKIVSPISGLLCGSIVIIALLINSSSNIGINFITSLISTPLFIYLVIKKRNI